MSEKPPKQPVADGDLSEEGKSALSRLEQAYGAAGSQIETQSETANVATSVENELSNQELVDSVSDLTDGRFSVDSSDNLRNAKGSTSLGENVGGQYTSRKQLEMIAEHADLIRDGLKDRNGSIDQPEEEAASTEEEPVAVNNESLSQIAPGDTVTSSKSSSDGYYEAGAKYTVQAVKKNQRTGKYEFHVTNFGTKEGGPTKSYLLSEDDIAGYGQSAETAVRATTVIDVIDGNEPSDTNDVVLDGDQGRDAVVLAAENVVQAGVAEADGTLRVSRAESGTAGDTTNETSQDSDESPEGSVGVATAEQGEGADATVNGEHADDNDESQAARRRTEILQGILDENNAALNEALTQEQRDTLAAIVAENNAALAEVSHREDDVQALAAIRTEKLAAADTAMNETELGAINHLQAKLAEYARRKADVDTLGGEKTKAWKFWQAGRQKRSEALKVAEEALFQAHNDYVDKLIRKRKEVGLYDELGDEELMQAVSDDAFRELLKLDVDARKATLETRKSRVDNRNIVDKALAGVGKFLNGGKGKGWIRNMGSGFLAGTGMALSGAGWPITTALAAGLTAGVRRGSRFNMLDTSLDDTSTKGMSEEEVASRRAGMARSGASLSEQRARLQSEMFGRARAEGKEKFDAAEKKANTNAAKFGAGFAAGNLATRGIDALLNKDASASAGPQTGGSGGEPDLPRPGDQPNPGAEALPSPEVVPDFSGIDVGEGWYHQLADMGYSQDQVQALFADHDLMNELVNQGAAYVDNSALIGGYGINMPASGHLTQQAMDTIRQAAASKGF